MPIATPREALCGGLGYLCGNELGLPTAAFLARYNAFPRHQLCPALSGTATPREPRETTRNDREHSELLGTRTRRSGPALARNRRSTSHSDSDF
jgi:hypothetical protein